MKKLTKTMARIRLFFLDLGVALNGGLAKPEIWRRKAELRDVINPNDQDEH